MAGGPRMFVSMAATGIAEAHPGAGALPSDLQATSPLEGTLAASYIGSMPVGGFIALMVIIGLALLIGCAVGAFFLGKRLAYKGMEGAPECPKGHFLRRRKALPSDRACEWCSRCKPEGAWIWFCKRCKGGWMICEDCLPFLGQHSACSSIEMGILPTKQADGRGRTSDGGGDDASYQTHGDFSRKREIEFVMHAPKKVKKRALEGTADFPDLSFCSKDEALTWLESRIRRAGRKADLGNVPIYIWEQNMLIVDARGEKYDTYDELPDLSQEMFPLLFWYGLFPEGATDDGDLDMHEVITRPGSSPKMDEALREARQSRITCASRTMIWNSRPFQCTDVRSIFTYGRGRDTHVTSRTTIYSAAAAGFGPNAVQALDTEPGDPLEKRMKQKRGDFARRVARFFAKQQKTLRVNLNMDLLEVHEVEEIIVAHEEGEEEAEVGDEEEEEDPDDDAKLEWHDAPLTRRLSNG